MISTSQIIDGSVFVLISFIHCWIVSELPETPVILPRSVTPK
jgi:hypothetical protein